MNTYLGDKIVSPTQNDLVDGDTYETKTTEEWVTSRKREVVTTTQVETRVKRQVILEDGDVINDTGPEITTETTEDVVEKKHDAEERKTGGGKPSFHLLNNQVLLHPQKNFVISEKFEKTVNTQEEKEEKTETEEVEHFGDLSHEELVQALRDKGDVRARLPVKRGGFQDRPGNSGNKRVVHYSSRHRRTVDTEDVKEQSKIKDGQLTSETTRTFEREEYNNEEVPDSEGGSDPGELNLESSHNLTHSKDENITEFIAVPKGASRGVKVGEVLNYSNENFQERREGDPIWERTEKHKRENPALKPGDNEGVERKDALTARPIDLDAEEATRKMETCKWLNEHFGTIGNQENAPFPAKNATYGGNIIKITMFPDSVINKDGGKTSRAYMSPSSPLTNGNNGSPTSGEKSSPWSREEKTPITPENETNGKIPSTTGYKSPGDSVYRNYRSREANTPLKDSPWAKSTYKSPLCSQISYMSRVANASDSGSNSLSSPRSPNTTKSPLPPWKDVYNTTPKPWSPNYTPNPKVMSPLREEYNRIVQELKSEEHRKTLRPVEERLVKNEDPIPPVKPERRKSPVKTTYTSDHFRQQDLSSPVYSPRGYSTLPNSKKGSTTLGRNESYTMGSTLSPRSTYVMGENPYKSSNVANKGYRVSSPPVRETVHIKHAGTHHMGSNYLGEPPARRSSVGDTLDEVGPRRRGYEDRSQTLPRKSLTKTLPDLSNPTKTGKGLPKFYFGDYSGSLVSIPDRVSQKPTAPSYKSVNRSQSFNVTRKPTLSNGLSSNGHNRVNFGSKVTIHGETNSQVKLREPEAERRVTRTNSMRNDMESSVTRNGHDTHTMNERNKRITTGLKTAPEHDTAKRKNFLQGLLNTAPELFMHLHGDEDIERYDLKKEEEYSKFAPSHIANPKAPTPPPRKRYGGRHVSSPTPNVDYQRNFSPSPPDTPPELIRPEDIIKGGHLPEKIPLYEPTQRSPTKFKTSAPMYRKFSQITDDNDILSKSTPNLSDQRAVRPQISVARVAESPLRAHSTTKINQSQSFKTSDVTQPGKPTLTHTPSFGSQSSQHSRTIYYAKVPAPTGRRSSTPDAHHSSRSSRRSDSEQNSTIERTDTYSVTKTRSKDHQSTRQRNKTTKYIDIKPEPTRVGSGINIEVRDWNNRK